MKPVVQSINFMNTLISAVIQWLSSVVGESLKAWCYTTARYKPYAIHRWILEKIQKEDLKAKLALEGADSRSMGLTGERRLRLWWILEIATQNKGKWA